MFNIADMMHSLSNLSYNDLERICAMEGVCTSNCFSKVELITAIIVSRACKENKPINERTHYRLREYDGTEHYVMLTPEQERFMRWNYDNNISYVHIDIDNISNIDWETP